MFWGTLWVCCPLMALPCSLPCLLLAQKHPLHPLSLALLSGLRYASRSFSLLLPACSQTGAQAGPGAIPWLPALAFRTSPLGGLLGLSSQLNYGVRLAQTGILGLNSQGRWTVCPGPQEKVVMRKDESEQSGVGTNVCRCHNTTLLASMLTFKNKRQQQQQDKYSIFFLK